MISDFNSLYFVLFLSNYSFTFFYSSHFLYYSEIIFPLISPLPFSFILQNRFESQSLLMCSKDSLLSTNFKYQNLLDQYLAMGTGLIHLYFLLIQIHTKSFISLRLMLWNMKLFYPHITNTNPTQNIILILNSSFLGLLMGWCNCRCPQPRPFPGGQAEGLWLTLIGRMCFLVIPHFL